MAPEEVKSGKSPTDKFSHPAEVLLAFSSMSKFLKGLLCHRGIPNQWELPSESFHLLQEDGREDSIDLPTAQAALPHEQTVLFPFPHWSFHEQGCPQR